MNKCKGCKWWQEDGFWKNKTHKRCKQEKVSGGEDESVSHLDDAYIFSTDPQGETFWTGPEFGCVHWEQKQ
jgi:hypothetical protein